MNIDTISQGNTGQATSTNPTWHIFLHLDVNILWYPDTLKICLIVMFRQLKPPVTGALNETLWAVCRAGRQ